MNETDRWLTFDCFGTLVSWQRGFPSILQKVAGPRARELADAYHRYENQVEAGEYRPYKGILRTTLRLAAQSIDLALEERDYDILSREWDRQPVWEDVGPALREVRQAGWKVAALTNCDNDLFERTKATLPFSFDAVITAEDVRSYKPAPAHFLRFRERGIAENRWVHVACSYFHDIAPAHELGIRSVWIDRDRTGEDPAAARAVQRDLRGLAATVGRISGEL
ncbi:MAG TPA: HAD family hydrolase [Candidatus Baltobacteraceae bacterium]|jgi:2-haloacid dehalogenase|nr:HAD family hydrolase [Candidatus Baltobacteraceae bacterium]